MAATLWTRSCRVPILVAAGLSPPGIDDAKTPHAKAIKLGQWLGAKVGREIPVCVRGRNGKAVLRVVKGRSRETQYYIEVTWEQAKTWEQAEAPEPPPTKAVKPSPKKEKPPAKGNAASKPTVPKSMVGRKPATGGNDEEWE
jgi:hypothetical protein